MGQQAGAWLAMPGTIQGKPGYYEMWSDRREHSIIAMFEVSAEEGASWTMLQGPWTNAILKPAKGWSADPLNRYVDGAIVRTKSNYTNRASKRRFKGEG